MSGYIILSVWGHTLVNLFYRLYIESNFYEKRFLPAKSLLFPFPYMQSKHRSFSSQLLPSSEQYFPFPLGAGFWQYLIRLRMHFLVFGTGSQSDHCSHAPQLPSEFHIYNEKRRDCHHFIMPWLEKILFKIDPMKILWKLPMSFCVSQKWPFHPSKQMHSKGLLQ